MTPLLWIIVGFLLFPVVLYVLVWLWAKIVAYIAK